MKCADTLFRYWVNVSEIVIGSVKTTMSIVPKNGANIQKTSILMHQNAKKHLNQARFGHFFVF